MVAGIVAELASKARLMPIKVLDSDGGGNVWDLAQGIRSAGERGAHVLNLSLSAARRSLLLELALEDADARVPRIAGGAHGDRASVGRCPTHRLLGSPFRIWL